MEIQLFQTTPDHERIVYRMEYQKVTADIDRETSERHKNDKIWWQVSWWRQVTALFAEKYPDETLEAPRSSMELLSDISKLLEETSDRAWYYIAVLDAEFFQPYFPLADQDNDKYKKLKFREKDFMRALLQMQGGVSPEYIAKIRKTYKEAFLRLKKTGPRVAAAVLATGAIGGGVFLGARAIGAIAAPKIAVAMIPFTWSGSGMPLYGAAASSKALAILGGGSLAAGGGGMAAGTATIATAVGAAAGANAITAAGAVSSGIVAVMLAYPNAALHTAARTETIIKEVFLSGCVGGGMTVEGITALKEAITKLEHLRIDLIREEGVSKEEKTAIEQSIKYLGDVYKEVDKCLKAMEKRTKKLR